MRKLRPEWLGDPAVSTRQAGPRWALNSRLRIGSPGSNPRGILGKSHPLGLCFLTCQMGIMMAHISERVFVKMNGMMHRKKKGESTVQNLLARHCA